MDSLSIDRPLNPEDVKLDPKIIKFDETIEKA